MAKVLKRDDKLVVIRRVIDDIPEEPKFSAPALTQRFQDVIDAWVMKVVPAPVAQIWSGSLSERQWLSINYLNFGQLLGHPNMIALQKGVQTNVSVMVPHRLNVLGSVSNIPQAVIADLIVIKKEFDHFTEKRAELEANIRSAVMALRTLEDMKKEYPDFIKYLPVEAKVVAPVPAVVNVIPELASLGWPAGKKEVAA